MLTACLTALTVAFTPAACTNASGSSPSDTSAQAATLSSDEVQPPRPPLTEGEKLFYRDVAKQSWGYMVANTDPATGLAKATPDWANTTLWDVGGQLLATLAAKDLQIITQADFDSRTKKLFDTVEKMELWNGVYNKLYSTKTGAISKEGRLGWSATDLGRFLLSLKILAQREPRYAAQAERIVRRMDYKDVIKKGYMHGQLIGEKSGKPWSFQEGRIGYEQYSAEGFRQWGMDVGNAINVKKNAQNVKILGVPLYQDRRYDDRLLSEPFILYGLEIGMQGDYLNLARNVLKAQEARYKSTGKITIATEDAVAMPPHYFFYYCIYCSRKAFMVDLAETGKLLDSPRWVSTKGAFGWHAILPNAYTKQAFDFVASARDPRKGWASGVFEDTGKSTQTFDINTAAVLLEVAAYQMRGGRPLIQ
jgi:hypothetical protein